MEVLLLSFQANLDIVPNAMPELGGSEAGRSPLKRGQGDPFINPVTFPYLLLQHA